MITDVDFWGGPSRTGRAVLFWMVEGISCWIMMENTQVKVGIFFFFGFFWFFSVDD